MLTLYLPLITLQIYLNCTWTGVAAPNCSTASALMPDNTGSKQVLL